LQEDGAPRSKRQKTRHSDGDEDADEDDADGKDGEEEEDDRTEAEQTQEISYSDKKDKHKSKSKPAREDTTRGRANSPMRRPTAITPKKSGPIAALYASMDDGTDMSPGKGDRGRERRKGSRDDAASNASESIV